MSQQQAAIKRYSLGEEIFNAVTHGTGSLLAIAGTAVLIVKAAFTGSAYAVVSSAIFGATLILLYTMSTLYHSLTNPTAKMVMRVFDHNTIFLLIAGTYTPFTLVSLRGPWGWTIFGVVWGAAVLGVVLNSISIEKFKWFSMICYVASGWAIVAAIFPLVHAMSLPGIVLLIGGGVAYTGGIVFYALKKIKYMHSIWHLFVLAGSVLHYFAILFYVIK